MLGDGVVGDHVVNEDYSRGLRLTPSSLPPPVFNVAPLLACPDGRWKRCSAVLENRARKSNGFGCGKQSWRHGTQTPEEEWWWCGKRIRQTLA